MKTLMKKNLKTNFELLQVWIFEPHCPKLEKCY